MPSPLCKGWNVCLLESFQLFNELFCVLNGGNADLKPRKLVKSGFDFFFSYLIFFFFFFFLSGLLYHNVYFGLEWDLFCLFSLFVSACILTHALILPGIPYRSAIVSLTAILPEGPFVLVLNHSWMHLLCEKKRDFFFFKVTICSLFSCCKFIFNSVETEKRKMCLLFLQRRIPLDCH